MAFVRPIRRPLVPPPPSEGQEDPRCYQSGATCKLLFPEMRISGPVGAALQTAWPRFRPGPRAKEGGCRHGQEWFLSLIMVATAFSYDFLHDVRHGTNRQ